MLLLLKINFCIISLCFFLNRWRKLSPLFEAIFSFVIFFSCCVMHLMGPKIIIFFLFWNERKKLIFGKQRVQRKHIHSMQLHWNFLISIENLSGPISTAAKPFYPIVCLLNWNKPFIWFSYFKFNDDIGNCFLHRTKTIDGAFAGNQPHPFIFSKQNFNLVSDCPLGQFDVVYLKSYS